jgi:hypothetical protein
MRESKFKIKALIAAALLATALAAVFAGCGSSSDADETTSSLTKAQFISQGDKICAKADKQQEDLLTSLSQKVQKTGKAMDDEELILAAGLPPLRKELEELEVLGVPADDTHAEAILAGIEQAIEKTESKPTLLIEPTTSPFAKVEAKARAYGFKVCGAA